MALSRRRFLGTVASGSLALAAPGRALAAASQDSRAVFAHGVASDAEIRRSSPVDRSSRTPIATTP